jgi:hypothetical protein
MLLPDPVMAGPRRRRIRGRVTLRLLFSPRRLFAYSYSCFGPYASGCALDSGCRLTSDFTTTDRRGAIFDAGDLWSRVPAPGSAGQAVGQVGDGLDLDQPVVLGGAFAPGRGAGLDLAAAAGHGEVSDEGVLGFAGPV